MNRLKLTKENRREIINTAVDVLERGGLVIFPTETCYGAGVLAENEQAVKKLLKYKKRPAGKPISIAVTSEKEARNYVEINEMAKNVYDNFLPGPVTVVSTYLGGLSDGLASEQGTLGVRIPNYELVLELIGQLNQKPISATSANLSGQKTPYSIEDILSNISKKNLELVDLIIDAGQLPSNPPSTVIDTTKSDLQIIRSGEIKFGSNVDSLETSSEEEMKAVGYKLIKNYSRHLKEQSILILFNADLGAGKTHFVKGVGEYLEILEIINSPTYSIINEYDYDTEMGRGKLVHIDAWRLESLEELKELNLDEYFEVGNIIAVEWSGAAYSYFSNLSENRNSIKLSVKIDYIGLNKRLVSIKEH